MYGGGARTHAHYRHAVLIAAEIPHVAMHPSQRHRLVLQRKVARTVRITRGEESEYAQPVGDSHEDNLSGVHEVLWPQYGRAGAARKERTTVDEHNDGQLFRVQGPV